MFVSNGHCNKKIILWSNTFEIHEKKITRQLFSSKYFYWIRNLWLNFTFTEKFHHVRFWKYSKLKIKKNSGAIKKGRIASLEFYFSKFYGKVGDPYFYKNWSETFTFNFPPKIALFWTFLFCSSRAELKQNKAVTSPLRINSESDFPFHQ